MGDSIRITFNLSLPSASKEITAPLMLARGYERKKILELFEKLQEEGFGKFDRGRQGRGNVAKFIPNDICPEEYTMEFVLKKRGRPKKLLEG